jgi:hypothetical protein
VSQQQHQSRKKCGCQKWHSPAGSSAAFAAAEQQEEWLQQPTPAEQLLERLQPGGIQEQLVEPTVTLPEGITVGIHPQSTDEQRSRLMAVLRENKPAFAGSTAELQGYHGDLAPVGWEMDTDRPIWSHPNSRRYPLPVLDIIEQQCGELRDAGFIVPCETTNKYSSMLLLAAKKDPQTALWTAARMCVDLRGINSHTVPDQYVPPLPEDLFRELKSCNVMTLFDLRSGFMQLPLTEAAANTTAFWWPTREGPPQLWKYVRLPFGGRNSVALFQQVMDYELGKAGLSHCARAYVDDVIVFSASYEQHIKDLDAVLKCLSSCGLRAHPTKTRVGMPSMEFVGHMVCGTGISPVQAKVQAMVELPAPRNVSELRTVLGCLNYYRCYVPGFSDLAAPLNKLTSPANPFTWGDEQQAAYDAIKAALSTPGVGLRFPVPDHTFVVHADWSERGLGAVLGQRDDAGAEYMVACASRLCNEYERKYEPWRGEMLACVYAVRSFRFWLFGRKFELWTDHRPLLWLLTASDLSGQQLRWVMALQEFSFTIRHSPGKLNNADALSRFPQATSMDTSGARLGPGLHGGGQLPHVVMPDGRVLPGEQLVPAFGVATQPAGTRPARQVKAAELMPGQQQQGFYKTAAKPSHAAHAAVPPAAATAAAALAPAMMQPLQAAAAAVYAQQLRQELCNDGVDCWAPTTAQLVNLQGSAFDGVRARWPELPQWRQEQAHLLQQHARAWVTMTTPTMVQQHQPAQHQQDTSVDITCVGATFFAAAAQQGVILYEPFGGLCAGLEMVLRNGIRVRRYLYSDTDATARRIASYRMHQLSAAYPELFPMSAWDGALCTVSADVWQVHQQQQISRVAAALPGQQWLLVAGWECQDLSPAGTNAGLQGKHSSTYFPLLGILRELQQQLQGQLPAAYLIENTSFQYNWRSAQISQQQYAAVLRDLGHPVLLDAAQLGSRAARLRNYWTNMCPVQHLQATLSQVLRPPHQLVQQVLGPGRVAAPVRATAQLPWYPANEVGRPMETLPTLMSYKGSRAFRPGRAGSVWDTQQQCYTEPTADERELALGYLAGDTAAPGVTEQQRCEALGRCMDANAMQYLYALSAAWYERMVAEGHIPGLIVAALRVQCNQQPAIRSTRNDSNSSANAAGGYQLLAGCVLAALAAEQEQQQGTGCSDIWYDETTLYMLHCGDYPAAASAQERNRAQKRLRYYMQDGTVLRRCMPDGSYRAVPPPDTREAIIQQAHAQGHYGVRRTASMVLLAYWWYGLLRDVKAVVSRCQLCDRVRASFSRFTPQLHPLPIMGLGYRWSCDLASPFEASRVRGNEYVMVMVEHFSKYAELAAIPGKEAQHTAYAFARHVLASHGCPAEVLTDRGLEWASVFAAQLQRHAIDHRLTSPLHPQADGLTERLVQTVKRSLQKMVRERSDVHEWDTLLPSLQLAYNASTQAATGFAPYLLVYGVAPCLPPATRDKFSSSIILSAEADIEQVAQLLVTRQQLMEDRLLLARSSLEVAQHRMTLRYARMRDGTYVPSTAAFKIGDYVYIRTGTGHSRSLQINVRPVILRVKEVRQQGVLLLEGRDGRTCVRHATTCTLCHLPNIDPEQDLSEAPVGDIACQVCNCTHDEAVMLVCTWCATGWHTYCLDPPLADVPDGDWLCPTCGSSGITQQQVDAKRTATLQLQQQQQVSTSAERRMFPTALQRRRDAQRQLLSGRRIYKTNPALHKGPGAPVQGVVEHIGSGATATFRVAYDDGTVEDLTGRQMGHRQKWLLPARSAAAVAATEGGRIAPPSSSQRQQQYTYSSRHGAQQALTRLMPGLHPWNVANAVATAYRECTSSIACIPSAQGRSEATEQQLKADFAVLLGYLQLNMCRVMADPLPGTSGLVEAAAANGVRNVTPNFDKSGVTAAGTSKDGRSGSTALSEQQLQALRADVFCTAPPTGLLDLVVPLLAAAAPMAAIVWVPVSWMANPTETRRRYLSGIKAAGQLETVTGMLGVSWGRRGVWVIICHSQALKHKMFSSFQGVFIG